MISVIGPAKGQTYSDYLTETIFMAFKGDEKERKLGKMTLNFLIISELHRPGQKEKFDENGSKLVTAVYNHQTSVEKDLELTDYGVSPFVDPFFPVLDSFAVFGKLGRSDAGFILDYFSRDIKLPKTAVVSKSFSKSRIRDAARSVFDFKNPDGKSAYVERDSRRGIVDLSPYKGKKNLRALICEGELAFNGPPISQNDVARTMLENVSQYRGFTPKKWVIKHYDFKIDFKPEDGEEVFNRKYEELGQRIHRVLEKKAARTAAA